MTWVDIWNWIVRTARAKPPPPPPPPTAVPWGPPGSWRAVFEDTFDGPAVNTKWWSLNTWGGAKVCNVNTSADNVAIVNGELVLTLSDENTGATINTNPVDHYSTPGKVGFEAPVGSVCEARVFLPGDGTRIFGWSGWWTGGQDWPRNGEHDIVEILDGAPTVNYHSRSGSHNQGAVPGYWGDAWHTYTLHRKTKSADVYWDGQLVKSYPTDDSGGPHSLLLSVGNGGFYQLGVGMRVDYVRVWNPA